MAKTRLAVTKQYVITIRALPAHHKIFMEIVTGFLRTLQVKIYGKPVIETKSI